jgi:hypothetical protein
VSNTKPQDIGPQRKPQRLSEDVHQSRRRQLGDLREARERNVVSLEPLFANVVDHASDTGVNRPLMARIHKLRSRPRIQTAGVERLRLSQGAAPALNDRFWYIAEPRSIWLIGRYRYIGGRIHEPHDERVAASIYL